jgi:GT2 family glycosyltransferase
VFVNEGIKYSLTNTDDKYILLLNNDIEIDANFLQRAVDTFERYPDASLCAVKMLNYYNREIIDDCGDQIKGTGGSPIARGHDEKDTGQYDKTEYIFGACAGAAFYRREVFDKVGFFDETFFAYYEDIDLSFRCQLAGLKCIYEPTIVCYHKRGGTSQIATHGFQTEMCERNLILMRFKNYPLSIYMLYQPFFFVARLRRYWSFWKIVSFSLLLRGIRGYLRGQFLLWTKIGERFRIQRNKKVSASYIKNLFVK